jgi:hypothetical protein
MDDQVHAMDICPDAPGTPSGFEHSSTSYSFIGGGPLRPLLQDELTMLNKIMNFYSDLQQWPSHIRVVHASPIRPQLVPRRGRNSDPTWPELGHELGSDV